MKRRDFIRTAGILTAGAVAGGVLAGGCTAPKGFNFNKLGTGSGLRLSFCHMNWN